MGIRKIANNIRKLEEQRRLNDPFYAHFSEQARNLSNRLSEAGQTTSATYARYVHPLEIALDALWYKYEETRYRTRRIEDLTQKILSRTFNRTVTTSLYGQAGPKVGVSLAIDSDEVSFEFDAFLKAAKGACDKLAQVAYNLLAAFEGPTAIQGLNYRSINAFVTSAKKKRGHNPILSMIVTAWGDWIKDLDKGCRDFVEHEGRYFMYARNPDMKFPIAVPPPKWFKELTRQQINALSPDELPMGNEKLPDYCKRILGQLQQLVISVMDEASMLP